VKSNAYRILVGKLKGRRPLGRPRYRWGIILKWILDRMGWYGLDSYGSGQRPVNMVMNLRVSESVGEILE
jgi:hypothetical protein